MLKYVLKQMLQTLNTSHASELIYYDYDIAMWQICFMVLLLGSVSFFLMRQT